MTPRAFAQDAASAAAAAERQEAEERYRRLNAAVEALQATQESQQKTIRDLRDKLSRLLDDASKPSPKYATVEDLNRLSEKLKELDEKRQADKELILSKIEALVKTLKDTPVTPVKPPPAARATPAPHASDTEKGYEYAIQKNDTIGIVVAAYNEDFKKQGKKTITVKQVLEANPGLNPNNLKVGQKIFIPLPE